ncbi:MAG: 50S ribosomal protein L9 [Agathobacter sp.]|nr:50S ribosomal protein L9 [Agathobacter sp.]
MKVILLEDVKAQGKKGEIIEVSDAYARNVLIAKKLGLEATPKTLNDLKLQKKHEEKVAKEQYEAAVALGKEIETKKVIVKVKCGDGGRLFGTVSTKEIAAAAKAQMNLELDKKKMQLADPIKALGTYEVPVKLHQKVTTTLKVQVVEG